jgi:hypothetical protein
VRRKVPTKDPKVYKKRLDFALRWEGCNTNVIIFSDEHTCSCNDSSSRTQWVRPGDALTTRMRKRVHNTARVNIWAAIGIDFKRLVVLPERLSRLKLRLNSQTYIEHCLSSIFGDTAGRIFMQDGARPHTAKCTMRRLKQEGVDVLEGWPPYSPDLNPTEDLWAVLNSRASECHPTTAEELRAAVLRAWESLDLGTVNRFCRSFRKKLARCIERKGLP